MTRFSADERPALVLSGGALLGAVQVGVLKVLFQAGFRPSLVVGTSVGALNGAFVAFHPKDGAIEQLEAIWHDLRASRVFGRNPLRMAYTLLNRGNCIFGNDLLEKIVCRELPVDDFAAAKVPLYLTAANLTKGEKVVFQEGPVSRAVLASTAVPGLFCPVESGGDLLVDGGLVANLDIETAIRAGAKEILAIDLTGLADSYQSSNILGVLNRSMEILLREQVQRDIERFSTEVRITVVRPQFQHQHTISSFTHISHLIEKGESLGRRLVDECLDARGRLEGGIVTDEVEEVVTEA
jgi:NTE family protein